jgi:hypothetical protein
MKIRYHVAVNNRLQRSVVELDVNGPLARRIVHFVRPEDGSPLRDLETPLWQEYFPGFHDYHHVDSKRAAELEKAFVAEVIANANHPAPMKDELGAWKGERDAALTLEDCLLFPKPCRQPYNT